MTATLRLESVFRYPVKSMAGEKLDSAQMTARGVLGDRAYALVDGRNKVGTAKRLASLLNFQARFVDAPRLDEAIPAVAITLPDGKHVTSEQGGVAATLSAALDHEVTLAAQAPQDLLLEFAAGTLGGKYAATTELPVAGASPASTFFDYATVHLITTATLRQLQEHYPRGRFDVRRFRPNLVIETGETGFVENAWGGRTLAIGDEVLLKVSIPCPRCVMPTLPQGDLPHDPDILRTAVEHNRLDLGDFGNLPCVGVYADVVRPGLVRVGDSVRLIDSTQ